MISLIRKIATYFEEMIKEDFKDQPAHMMKWMLISLLLGLFITPFFFIVFNDPNQVSQLVLQFYPEAVGIGFTVFVLDRIYENRRKQEQAERDQQLVDEQLKELQQRLIRDAGSSVKAVAIKAIEDLRLHKWLTGEDGVLKEANLRGANLEGADLRYVNLKNANLDGANLRDAKLTYSNLANADLQKANLLDAKLFKANLKGANLNQANLKRADLAITDLSNATLLSTSLVGADLVEAVLQKADLRNANLQSANLERAKLQGVNLEGAKLLSANLKDAMLMSGNLQWANLKDSMMKMANLGGADLLNADLTGAFLVDVIWETEINGITHKTVLPDGTPWTPIDITRYTDENHPHYWKPPQKESGE